MNISFPDFLNKPIILITNDVGNLDEISGIRIPGETHIYLYEDRYVLTRVLNNEDLLDEDYIIYLNNLWNTEKDIYNFLTQAEKIT